MLLKGKCATVGMIEPITKEYGSTPICKLLIQTLFDTVKNKNFTAQKSLKSAKKWQISEVGKSKNLLSSTNFVPTLKIRNFQRLLIKQMCLWKNKNKKYFIKISQNFIFMNLGKYLGKLLEKIQIL